MRPRRLLQRAAIAVAALGVLVPAALYASAQLSLDRALHHSQRTQALPFLAPRQPDGLVQIRARGLVFRARVAGLANDGPALLLLHGFPETSVMWEPLLAVTAAEGYRVAAFDQRGYSPGARPASGSAYAIDELTADALAVADALGFERFHLVGHDWGSVVGWTLASEVPLRVQSWTSLSIPHPGAVFESRPDSGPPLYIRLFRLPGVAETLLGVHGRWLLRNVVYAGIPDDLLAEYMEVFAEPGALTAALDWYRAAGGTPGAGVVAQPVLYMWGRHDLPVFVNPRVRALQEHFVTGPYEGVELDAGHWLIQEERERVLSAVLAHLQRSEDGAARGPLADGARS